MNTLVIVAHPDDPEFFCGGAIARWAAAGDAIRYVIVTGGDKGSDDPDMTPERLVALRQIEQRKAAARLGVDDIVFLGYVDGELANTLGLQRDLCREIRRFAADRVVTTDPLTLSYHNTRVNHNDHRIIGQAVCDALFPAAGNRMYFPELLAIGFAPHAPKELWFSGPTMPNTLLDVTDWVDAKISAIREHPSQVKDPEGIARRIPQGLFRMRADGSRGYFENYRRVVL